MNPMNNVIFVLIILCCVKAGCAIWTFFKKKGRIVTIGLALLLDTCLVGALILAYIHSDPRKMETKISEATALIEQSIEIFENRKLEEFLEWDGQMITCLEKYEEHMQRIFRVDKRDSYSGFTSKWVKLYLVPAYFGGEPIKFTYGKEDYNFGLSFSQGDYVYYPPDSQHVRKLAPTEQTILDLYLKICKEGRSFSKGDFSLTSSEIKEKIIANQVEIASLLESLGAKVRRDLQAQAKAAKPEKIEYGDKVDKALLKIEHILLDSRHELVKRGEELKEYTGSSQVTQISEESLDKMGAAKKQRIQLLLESCNNLGNYISTLEQLQRKLLAAKQRQSLSEDTAEFAAESKQQDENIRELVTQVETLRLELGTDENFLDSALISEDN
jgi:hypothetical protein